ncbi:hypothetical protein OTU49_017389, partial [Cherax quadricarinatus]
SEVCEADLARTRRRHQSSSHHHHGSHFTIIIHHHPSHRQRRKFSGMRTHGCLLLLPLLLAPLVDRASGFGLELIRRSRQAVQCQPGDVSCEKCSRSCSSVEVSRLPECCEAYNTCCDQYFQACKKCSSMTSKDQYFPEYCCASFTDCCHLITTFNTQVKPPEPVRAPSKSASLKIPTVAAPKPSTFPGSKFSQRGTPKSQNAPVFLDSQDAATDSLGFEAFQPPEIKPDEPQPPVPQSPVQEPPEVQPTVTRGPAQRGGGRGSPSQGRGQQPRPRQRQQGGHRPSQNLEERRGRITSRGRVIS